MKQINANDFVLLDGQGKGNQLRDFRASYPKVFSWLEQIGDPYLSEVGEINYARRFRMPLQEFQALLKAYQADREAGKR